MMKTHTTHERNVTKKKKKKNITCFRRERRGTVAPGSKVHPSLAGTQDTHSVADRVSHHMIYDG